MELKIEKNKYSLAELALLGIFAIGLLLSFLIVSGRKKILFSPPIKAAFDGLSISMPFGRGWQGHDMWQYSSAKNTFVLQSVLMRSSTGVAQVTWQYYPAPEKKDFEEVISGISEAGGFAKVRPGNITIDALDFTTLVFASPNKGLPDGIEDYYYAYCKLPFGRELRLEVRTAGDGDLAKQIFESVIQKIKYTGDSRLVAGNIFIENVKSAGVHALIKRETAGTSRRFYLVKKTDSVRNNSPGDFEGFTVELFSRVNDLTGHSGISTSALYFIEGANGWTGKSLFDCDKSFTNFYWQTKQSSLDNKVNASLVVEYEDSVLRSRERNFVPSSISIPELFIDSLAAAFLDQASENVLVDLIMPDGKVLPAEISKIAVAADNLIPNVDSAVRFTMYNMPNSYSEIYFDQSGKIIGKTEKSGQTFELERTNINEIITQYKQFSADIEEMLK